MTLAALLDRTLTPLDAARRVVLQLAIRQRALRAVLARRDTRLAAIITAHAVLALVLAVFAPLLLLVLGPIVLGVAHVAADVRYLVLRRALPAWWKRVVLGGCLALIGVRVAEEAGLASLARLEMALVGTWLVVATLAGAVSARSGQTRGRTMGAAVPGSTPRDSAALGLRARVGLAVALGLLAAAVAFPATARLVFVHVHNLVALVLWVMLFRRRPGILAVPLLLIAVGAVFLVSGAAASLTWQQGNLQLFGLHLFNAVDWLAPGLSSRAGIGLLCGFVFLQSVHYLVWLVTIPGEDTRGQGSLTFRMSGRALLRDFGGFALLGVLALAVLVVAGAFVDVLKTRGMYLSLAMFHGYMELALLAYFWARGRPRA